MRARLEQEGQYRQLDPGLLGDSFLRLAEAFQFADIRQIKLGDMGHIQPAAMNVGCAGLLQAGHVPGFDFAKAAEVDCWHRWNTCTACRRWLLLLLGQAFDVFLHVFLEDAVTRPAGFHLGQFDAELAGEQAYRWTGMHLGAFAAGPAHRRRCFLLGGRRLFFRGLCFTGALGVVLFGGFGRRFVGCFAGWRGFFARRRRFCSVASLAAHMQDQVTGAGLVALLDLNRFHSAGKRCRNFHAGLVRLQHDQRLVSLNPVALGHEYFYHFGLAVRTQIRDFDFLYLAAGCVFGAWLSLGWLRWGLFRLGFFLFSFAVRRFR